MGAVGIAQQRLIGIGDAAVLGVGEQMLRQYGGGWLSADGVAFLPQIDEASRGIEVVGA